MRVLCVLGYRVVRVSIWDLNTDVKHFLMGHRRVCTRLRLRLCFGSVNDCYRHSAVSIMAVGKEVDL